MISPKKQIATAERQIAVSYIVAENFLLINITLCGNNWRAPSHSAQTLERRSNQSAHESRSAESQFHTYEISRVLRDEGGMIQQNPVSTIGGEKGVGPRPTAWQQLSICEPHLNRVMKQNNK